MPAASADASAQGSNATASGGDSTSAPAAAMPPAAMAALAHIAAMCAYLTSRGNAARSMARSSRSRHRHEHSGPANGATAAIQGHATRHHHGMARAASCSAFNNGLNSTHASQAVPAAVADMLRYSHIPPPFRYRSA